MNVPGESEPRIVEPSQLHVMVDEGVSTSGLALRGAVIRTWRHGSGRLGLLVRDTNYRNTAVVSVDVAMPTLTPDRGAQIEVVGELATQRGKQLTIERLCRGEMLHVAGVAAGFLRRERHAREERNRTRLVVPGARCDRLFVVTSEGSKAWQDVVAALAEVSRRASHALASVGCERVDCNLYRPDLIAEALRLLRKRATPGDLVIVARGGGEWLDHFEDEAVISALGRLAEWCPTYTAIGHADDTLMLKGIVHGMFETPSSAIYRLDEMLRGANRSSPHEAATTRPMSTETSSQSASNQPCAEAAFDPERWRPAPAQPAASRNSESRLWPQREAWSVMIGALALVAVLGVVLLLVFPARRSAAPQPSARASGVQETRSAAQSDRSATLKPIDRPTRGPTAPSRARAASSATAPTSSAPATTTGLQRPAIEPAAIGDAPLALLTGHGEETPQSDRTLREALRLVASLLGPFEIGRDLGAVREACAVSHGIWNSSPQCRLPGGRVYRFGLEGGLVQTITLRQGERAPVPWLSAELIATLQSLRRSGRGPWRVAVTPDQLTVQPRPHHPGL